MDPCTPFRVANWRAIRGFMVIIIWWILLTSVGAGRGKTGVPTTTLSTFNNRNNIRDGSVSSAPNSPLLDAELDEFMDGAAAATQEEIDRNVEETQDENDQKEDIETVEMTQRATAGSTTVTAESAAAAATVVNGKDDLADDEDDDESYDEDDDDGDPDNDIPINKWTKKKSEASDRADAKDQPEARAKERSGVERRRKKVKETLNDNHNRDREIVDLATSGDDQEQPTQPPVGGRSGSTTSKIAWNNLSELDREWINILVGLVSTNYLREMEKKTWGVIYGGFIAYCNSRGFNPSNIRTILRTSNIVRSWTAKSRDKWRPIIESMLDGDFEPFAQWMDENEHRLLPASDTDTHPIWKHKKEKKPLGRPPKKVTPPKPPLPSDTATETRVRTPRNPTPNKSNERASALQHNKNKSTQRAAAAQLSINKSTTKEARHKAKDLQVRKKTQSTTARDRNTNHNKNKKKVRFEHMEDDMNFNKKGPSYTFIKPPEGVWLDAYEMGTREGDDWYIALHEQYGGSWSAESFIWKKIIPIRNDVMYSAQPLQSIPPAFYGDNLEFLERVTISPESGVIFIDGTRLRGDMAWGLREAISEDYSLTHATTLWRAAVHLRWLIFNKWKKWSRNSAKKSFAQGLFQVEVAAEKPIDVSMPTYDDLEFSDGDFEHKLAAHQPRHHNHDNGERERRNHNNNNSNQHNHNHRTTDNHSPAAGEQFSCPTTQPTTINQCELNPRKRRRVAGDESTTGRGRKRRRIDNTIPTETTSINTNNRNNHNENLARSGSMTTQVCCAFTQFIEPI